MPGTIVTNLYGTGHPASGPTEIGASGISRRLQIEMGSELYSISPASTPFLLLLNNVNKEESANFRFDYMEDYAFNIRTFEADIVVTHGAVDFMAHLRLRSPSDAQALEAPQYLTVASDYDVTDIILVKLSYAKATGVYTNIAWFILEKQAVEWASQWRTIDVAANPSAVDPADVTGYAIMLGYNDDAAATHVNFGVAAVGASASKGWHWDTFATNGGITYNEAIIVRAAASTPDFGDHVHTDCPALVTGDPTDDVGITDTPGADAGPNNDGVFPCYIEIFTPDMQHVGYFQGSGLPQESHRGVGHGFNYTQIFKTPLSMVGTARAVKYVGTDEWTRKRNRKASQHAEDMEQAFLFQGAETISNVYDDSPKTTTRGLGIGTAGLGSIRTFNVDRDTVSTVHADNTLLVAEAAAHFFSHMQDVCELVFEDHVMSSDTKLLMGGPRMASAFANAAFDTSSGFQYMPGEGLGKTWGLSVTTYITPHGTIKFMKHPKFRGRWNNYGVMLDMANLSYRYLPGRDNLLMTGTQDNSEDKYGEAFLTEAGLECKFEQTHSIIKLY